MKTLEQLNKGDTIYICHQNYRFGKVLFYVKTVQEVIFDLFMYNTYMSIKVDKLSTYYINKTKSKQTSISTSKYILSSNLEEVKRWLSSRKVDVTNILDEIYKYEDIK